MNLNRRSFLASIAGLAAALTGAKAVVQPAPKKVVKDDLQWRSHLLGGRTAS